ncbi:MAG: ROK family transcriptional regulator [Clostridiales bacterium]|nr:ROK family transcriptional regulator [Clostridiales bacterium]
MNAKSGSNQTGLKDANLSRIIRALHFDENCTRVSLARDMGLTQASITKLVNELIRSGLVVETNSVESSKGRRPIRIKLNGNKYLTLSGRVNRDYVSAALYNINGRLCYYNDERIRPAGGAREAMNHLKRMMREGLQIAQATVLGIGMALPGPFDARHGRIALMSGFPGWEQIDIRRELNEALALPVFLEQDANCGALAELWYGKYRNLNNMLYIAGDRGVGAGLILNGQLYKGMSGFAGELGHMSINCFGPLCECGNRGCLELYGSAVALEEEYQRSLFDLWQRGEGRSRAGSVTARDICRMVREDDALARCAYEKTIGYLAFGTAGMINTLNPEAVIYADRITEGGQFFLEVVRETLKRHLMRDVYEELIVDTSALQNAPTVRDPMLLGASVLVIEQMLETPSQTLLNQP